MVAQRTGMPAWLNFYPYKEAAQGLDPERPLFMDVGGGFGHQAIVLHERVPDLKNPFMRQPIKGAKLYYLRNIIHDYSDEKAIIIPRNLAAAMSPDSAVLIDDMMVPKKVLIGKQLSLIFI
ncbi:MAG: hypothetical protein LQ340_001839 [Diploschistes diacapsis]|nr:MAG: hypothetical protein LQ340_001839 [Diploschistes diacapsis]